MYYIDIIGIWKSIYLQHIVNRWNWWIQWFLAHHRWAFTITCCPSSSSSSVNTARIVTAGAIDLKLCAYVSPGQMTRQTKVRSDLILDFATRGPKPKTQKVLWLLNKWLDQPQIFIRGVSSKDAWHNTRVFDLTYLWRSQRSKFEMALLVGTFYYYLTRTFSQTKFRSSLILLI
jgi:hypothetical protein